MHTASVFISSTQQTHAGGTRENRIVLCVYLSHAQLYSQRRPQLMRIHLLKGAALATSALRARARAHSQSDDGQPSTSARSCVVEWPTSVRWWFSGLVSSPLHVSITHVREAGEALRKISKNKSGFVHTEHIYVYILMCISLASYSSVKLGCCPISPVLTRG